MSFSCPHFDPYTDRCDRVKAECVCGRPGCVLAHNSTFAVPAADRLPKAEVRPPGPTRHDGASPLDGASSE